MCVCAASSHVVATLTADDIHQIVQESIAAHSSVASSSSSSALPALPPLPAIFYIRTRSVPPHTTESALIAEPVYDESTTVQSLKAFLLQRSFPSGTVLDASDSIALYIYDMFADEKICTDMAVIKFRRHAIRLAAIDDVYRQRRELELALKTEEEIKRIRDRTSRSPSSVKPASSPDSPPKTSISSSSASGSASHSQPYLTAVDLARHGGSAPISQGNFRHYDTATVIGSSRSQSQSATHRESNEEATSTTSNTVTINSESSVRPCQQ